MGGGGGSTEKLYLYFKFDFCNLFRDLTVSRDAGGTSNGPSFGRKDVGEWLCAAASI